MNESASNPGFWAQTYRADAARRPRLERNMDVDVAIIGAGYSGLWTAYYLKQRSPQLNVVVLEAQTVGFGASGRNGGWLMGALEGERELLEPLQGTSRQAAHAIIHGIPAEVSRVLERESIQCDFMQSGTLMATARYPEQQQMAEAYLQDLYDQGNSEDDYRWLSADEMRHRVNMRDLYGGIYTPHTARIHPLKLVSGLADAVERLGVTIYEQTAVLSYGEGRVITEHATLKVDIIVPCVEGYNDHLKQPRKYVLPVQSQMLATAPLSPAVWESVGLANCETFSDFCRSTTYGQRTTDDRLLFGCRASYQFGGQPRSDFNPDSKEFRYIEHLLFELFPQLEGVEITHRWGGTLGYPRASRPHAIFHRAQGVGYIGGYVGEGVGASNLMARTLVDLMLEQPSELATMPWAHTDSMANALLRWEPEPFRWLAFKTVVAVLQLEERMLNNPQTPGWQRKAVYRAANQVNSIIDSPALLALNNRLFSALFRHR